MAKYINQIIVSKISFKTSFFFLYDLIGIKITFF